jgi:hypothetical protein
MDGAVTLLKLSDVMARLVMARLVMTIHDLGTL